MQIRRIRRHGVSVFRQDLQFSAIAALIGAVFWGITWAFGLGSDRWGSLLQTGVGFLLWIVAAAALLPPVLRDLAPKIRLPWIGGRNRSVAAA